LGKIQEVIASCILLAASVAADPWLGPEHGSLVIVGGGRLPAAVANVFINRAGGKDAAIVVIPTANEGESWGEDYVAKSFLTKMGVTDLVVLHTRDRGVADSEEFVKSLRCAKGVWIDGGRQWRLADSYLDTRTHRELWNVLHRGGVIGGSSAGATIQGSYLVRGAPEGNTIMMSPGHEVGFGFVRNVAIDQHVIARKRHFDLYPVICCHPQLLGFGIDEGTALVVEGNRCKVIGDSHVLVHNGNDVWDDPDVPYFTLRAGDEFDLRRRRRVD
jgi:cyanophycinase